MASYPPGKYPQDKAYAKAYRKKNRKKIAAHSRGYYVSHKLEASVKNRTNRLLKVFGLTEVDYAVRLASQNGLCAICRHPEVVFDPRAKKIRRLAIDHDHDTNKIRELLCSSCNRALGLFGDDVLLLEAAAAYLRKHSDV